VRPDAGTGLIGTLAGFTVVLALTLFAVQVLLNLFTTSAVTDAAHDGARRVAGARVDHGDPVAVATARADADRHVRELLGAYGRKVHLDWSASTADEVVLRVRADAPRVLIPGLAGPVGLDRVDRTVRVRVERPR
jgi:hypothetical protein